MKSEQAEPARIVVLISGSGTNMLAIAESCIKKEMDAEIVAVISNRPAVAGIERAEKLNIATNIVDHTEFASREEFDVNLIRAIDEHSPDIVILAGFMRILTADFVRRYKGKLVNIHPSLLPKHKGLNTHKHALEAGDKEHGVTVHFVSEELDGGPNIIQAVVPVLDDDNAQTLQVRVQAQEHIIFPIAIKWLAEGRLSMIKGDAYFDNQALPETGLQLTPEALS